MGELTASTRNNTAMIATNGQFDRNDKDFPAVEGGANQTTGIAISIATSI